MTAKLAWEGEVLAVQPRIRLMRSFDQRHHGYHGYVLRIVGRRGDEEGEFQVAVGKAAHAKHGFRIGDVVSGQGVPVPDPKLETADLYKVSGVKLASRGPEDVLTTPPFGGVAPPLEVYRARGHRRLAATTYAKKCAACIWACDMPVEMTIDQWNPADRRYRRETFCYGPKSCALHAAGPTRKVPGRKGMSWEEEDWVDEDATAHRGPDE